MGMKKVGNFRCYIQVFVAGVVTTALVLLNLGLSLHGPERRIGMFGVGATLDELRSFPPSKSLSTHSVAPPCHQPSPRPQSPLSPPPLPSLPPRLHLEMLPFSPLFPNPPPVSASSIVDELNARFWRGQPSDSLEAVGVLLRQYDTLSDIYHGNPWLPCRPEDWCKNYQHWWPASVINPHVRHLYQRRMGGFVLAPTVRFNCVYPEDGNTMQYTDSRGCHYCTPDELPLPHKDCAYAPSMLKEALEAQQRRGAHSHNEIILDMSSITPALPRSIQAFFYIDKPEQSRRFQQRFIANYGLNDAECPLVHLDLYSSGDPFKMA